MAAQAGVSGRLTNDWPCRLGMRLDDATLCGLCEPLLIIGLFQQARPQSSGRHAYRQVAQSRGFLGVGPHQFVVERAVDQVWRAERHAVGTCPK